MNKMKAVELTIRPPDYPKQRWVTTRLGSVLGSDALAAGAGSVRVTRAGVAIFRTEAPASVVANEEHIQLLTATIRPDALYVIELGKRRTGK